MKTTPLALQTNHPTKNHLGKASSIYNKKVQNIARQQEDIESDSDSDDEYERKRQNLNQKYSQKVRK